MGIAREHEPVLLVVGLFSNNPAAVDWAEHQLTVRFGPIADRGGPFEFSETSYYEEEMGGQLRYHLLAFERLIRPEWLPEIKLLTNSLEHRAIRELQGASAESKRVVNIDPGYLAAGKFVLATTKDQAHRIYLGNGIFAEVTLSFRAGSFEPWPWTYPNYRRADYRDVLFRFRQKYMNERRTWLRQGKTPIPPAIDLLP